MEHPKTGASRRSVLYVEDHPVNAMLMRAMFERRPSLHLVVAVTGQEALDLAPGLDPALLLLDLRLPDCHGSGLLPMLRKVRGCETAPAVAVTADGDFDLGGTGFCELWPKPLNLMDVLHRVDALVGADPPAAAPSAFASDGASTSRNVPTRLSPACG